MSEFATPLRNIGKFANSRPQIFTFSAMSGARPQADSASMLSNAPANGLDLLALMAASAAERASMQLTGTVRLARCESFELAAGFPPADIDLESWAIDTDRRVAVISVFATALAEGGARRMAGSGRFTFTTSRAPGGRV